MSVAAAPLLTFDNLGEAAYLERGEWPAEKPVGRHPTVVAVLPRLLDELDALELRATFFVEAINCELYPDAVREIAARGHEVGQHGWRHERWSELDPEREAELLLRGRAAFAEVGIDARGFRPPGGALTPRSPQLLREAGFAWCSPAGGPRGERDGLTYRPFRWELVDFFWRELPPAERAERLAAELERAAHGAGEEVLILHPFLMCDEPGWESGVRVLEHVAQLAAR